jgi:hypothetical protein
MGDINTGMKNFSTINRKLHIYLGLFILLFIWLFFVSGLIMNHGKWKASKFYENRVEEKTGFNVSASIINGNPDVVNTIKNHLSIAGEVSNIRIESGNIGFRVSSPGLVQEVNVDSTGKGSLKMMKYNFWGKLYTLHLFNGMNKNDPEQRPDWMVTKLWRIMMDTTAIVLIILSMGSWIMWYKVRKDYKAGYIFLAAGLIIAGYFLFFTELL